MANAIFKSLVVSKNNIKTHFKNKLPMINVGTGEEISIKKLSNLIASIYKFKGKIIFDSSYPDGTFRKKIDSSKIKKLGWTPKISLKRIKFSHKN